jgi:hypothetical protein
MVYIGRKMDERVRKRENYMDLLFSDTEKPLYCVMNSHNSHSASFQIGNYERRESCELIWRVVCSVSNESEIKKWYVRTFDISPVLWTKGQG